jgi:secondary thiamine-phosphate synthase enzyme
LSSFKVSNITRTFSTTGPIEFIDLSSWVQEAVAESGLKNGLVHVFAPHATGILILTENDSALLRDIKKFLEKIVPELDSYNHPSNAHAHLRSMILPPDRTLPVINGELAFGTWQSLLYVETDVYPRTRTIFIQTIGET